MRYQSTHARLNGIYLFYTLFGYGPVRNIGNVFEIFMLTICAGIKGQKLFITSFMIYAKRVRLLANLKLTSVVIGQ